MTSVENTVNKAQVINLRPSPKTEEPRKAPEGDATPKTNRTEGGAEITALPQKETVKSQKDERDPFERAAELIEEMMPDEDKGPKTRLRINRDEESGDFIYQSVDEETGEVVKQFPPETIQEMLSSYRRVEGLAIDSTA